MKKVIIIGAGIAGLTCGNYLQMNGFETEIYELHNIPGGECTGWDRKGYHFDGCIHWLVGSKPGTELHELWRDTGAIDDSVRIINHEVYTRYEENGKAVNMYTNADRLEKHLIEIAPEDKKEIKALCGAIRRMGGFGMPLDKPMDMMTAGDGIKFAAKNLRSIPDMSKYGKMTMQDVADKFTSPLIRRALLATMSGYYPAIALVSTLAGMHAGDCGYPEGGSRALAKRMEAKYTQRGGKVFYGKRVDTILIKDGRATGIRLADGQEVLADEIVSCADGYATLKYMLEDKYTPELYQKLFAQTEKYPLVTSALVFMGIDAAIPMDYRGVFVHRDAAADLNGLKSNSVSILHYGIDKNFAPEGKTVLACYYDANYDYWKALSADKKRYEAEKKRLAEDAIAAVYARYPAAQGKIEVADVVTPVTYERYCNAWRGTWMTWMKTNADVPSYYPGKLEGLQNFLMAGMWTLPPGGLPGAGSAGRFAAHRLCIQNGMSFKHGVL
jgi:phytoene dehydrogenase-like protein